MSAYETANNSSQEEDDDMAAVAAIETVDKTRKLEELKMRMEEMVAEAAAIRQLSVKIEMEAEEEAAGFALDAGLPKNTNSLTTTAKPGQATTLASKEEADSRSVFVTNVIAKKSGKEVKEVSGEVDYACTPEEVQQHFQTCETVNRVTIRRNKYGQPQGYAFVEFLDSEADEEALQLNESELHGRQLKVAVKRTNIPGRRKFSSFRRAVRFMPY